MMNKNHISPGQMNGMPQQVFIQEEVIDLREILFKYFIRYWYAYLLFAVIGAGLAYLYIQYANPVYQVSGKILIKEEGNNSLSTENMLLDNMDLFGTSENVANEIQILKSFSLMNDVVSKLNLEVEYYYKDQLNERLSFPDFTIQVDAYTLDESVKSLPSYFVGGGLSFEVRPINKLLFELIYDEEVIGEHQFGSAFNNDFGTFQFSVRDEESLFTDSLKIIKFKEPELLAQSYLNKLNVNLVDDDATMLELSLEEVSPARGVLLLNELVETYNAETVTDKNEIAINTLKFINERLGTLRNELSSVEGSVESYKTRNEITTEVATDLEIVMQEISRYTKEETELQVQLSIIQSMLSVLQSPQEFELIPANLSVANSSLTDLIEPYNEMILKRQLLLETAKANNPLVKSNSQQLISLRSSILNTINNIKGDIQKKLSSITEVNNELTERLKKVPAQERGLLEIKRQQVIKENLYLYLLQKREETALSLVATEANSKIIDTAKSTRQSIRPKKSIILLGSVMSSLFLPFLFILGRNVLKDTIQDEEELKGITTVPIIGTINQARVKEEVVVKSNSRTAISEQFRLIRTNLSFASKNETQTILVTSSISGEGKSFIALNLALSFALTRKKTIVLGFDLRKPKLKNYLGVDDNILGLTNYLIGKASIPEITGVSQYSPHLDYITSGPVPHNPNELLSEDTLPKLFKVLKEKYDVIIVDTPPLGLVSDAYLLNEHVNQVIYVARANHTKTHMLENLIDIRDQDKLNNLSILLNGVNIKNGYGYSRYGYGKEYGYYVED